VPDVSGLAALDVLIGLFFLYFLLSLACSAVQELVAQVTNLRGKGLAVGVRNLLEDEGLTDRFFRHPRLEALSQPRRLGGSRLPSYLPSRVFALTLFDTLSPAEPGASRDLIAIAERAVGDADVPDRVKTILRDALDEAGDRRDRLRAQVERSFDEAMDRVSGWYKRRTQIFLLVIALGVVGALNADSFVVGERLWRDDALRASVVASATEAAQAGEQTCPEADPGAAPQDQAAACVEAVEELNLPLGWTNTPAPSGWGILGKIGGLLVTAFALALGAPFWFDLLSKVARLRGSGPPAPPAEQREADRPAPRET
jgi:hypothetical protein